MGELDAGGYRIARVVARRPGLDALAEADAPDGTRVTLRLLERPLEGKARRSAVARLARVRASIVHPHVLPLLDDGKDRRRLVLDALPAGTVTLADRLRDGPLSAQEAVTLASQVAGALEVALRRGLAHRDLSPATVLVAGDDPPRALLGDFGIAVPDERGCRVRATIEEAAYRAPEELAGAAPTAASAVYSLACLLVACLTGAPPFPYDRPLLVMHAHLAEPPPRVSERDEALPAELDRVLARALAKEPQRRHASPAELIRTVQRALGIAAPIPLRGTPAREAAPAPEPAPAAPRPEPSRPAAPAPRPAPAAGEHAGDRRRPAAKRPRPARRRRPARRTGWATVRRLAPGWAGLALVASALAGFAAGRPGEEPSSTSAPATPAPGVSAGADPVVRPIVARLDRRRATERRRLRAAPETEAQAEVAERLARHHRAARAALLRAPGRVAGERTLAAALAAVERAYRRLARAAERGDVPAWRRAVEEVRASEVELELLLRARRWT
jgi:serine/threonine-protein kinase